MRIRTLITEVVVHANHTDQKEIAVYARGEIANNECELNSSLIFTITLNHHQLSKCCFSCFFSSLQHADSFYVVEFYLLIILTSFSMHVVFFVNIQPQNQINDNLLAPVQKKTKQIVNSKLRVRYAQTAFVLCLRDSEVKTDRTKPNHYAQNKDCARYHIWMRIFYYAQSLWRVHETHESLPHKYFVLKMSVRRERIAKRLFILFVRFVFHNSSKYT